MPSLFAMVPPHWVGNLAFKDHDCDMLMLLADNVVKAMLEEENGERRHWRAAQPALPEPKPISEP